LSVAYLDLSVQAVTGPGAGLGQGGLTRKIEIIERALSVNRAAVHSGDALRILAALGGYEIAGMAGMALGAAEASLPCLVDGFIAQAAFTAAWKLCPAVADYAVFAHASAEPGRATLLAALGRKPLLDLGLRLGEGTGCALALPLLRAACAVYNDMALLKELIKELA
jgi:nicotinate-nucleotide--dimethylbenzimidazole phosphoribosyltransferase